MTDPPSPSTEISQLVTEWEVFILILAVCLSRLWLRSNVNWRRGLGIGVVTVTRRHRGDYILGCAKNLPNVDVTVVVQLRVVGKKGRGVDTARLLDFVAGVVLLDDVDGGAVLSLTTEAENLAGSEVVAIHLDERVRGGELVGGDVLLLGNRIADVTLLNGILASARRVLSEDRMSDKRKD